MIDTWRTEGNQCYSWPIHTHLSPGKGVDGAGCGVKDGHGGGSAHGRVPGHRDEHVHRDVHRHNVRHRLVVALHRPQDTLTNLPGVTHKLIITKFIILKFNKCSVSFMLISAVQFYNAGFVFHEKKF